ncbi:hypothetical protein [Cesiribacter sp. SM1]|uniref:hypothetical protein n=1 Tax=Cesiribacter sp. SM1 TaxID=2861196 RepID=UPI001CD3F820|nr:hypothetical protein [Cesiribacter sp. SM1]
MKKPLLAIVFLTISVIHVLGQTAPEDVIGPSPNAAAFDKYDNVPVDYYTGVPNIAIPLHTIINKELQLPISLSYHAGGIRVDEEASRVGLGWVLNAGGVINRVVNGIDDFDSQYGYLKHDSPEFFDNQTTEVLKRGDNISHGECERYIAGRTVDLSDYLSDVYETNEQLRYDLEPDVYTYNFLGHSGKFSLKKNLQAVKQKSNAFDIRLLSNAGEGFQITDPTGIKYIFETTEACTIYTGNIPPNYITSWYLTKIIAPTGAEINFHYTSFENQDNTVEVLYNVNIKHTLYGSSGNLEDVQCAPANGGQPLYSYSSLKTYNLVLLDSITYPHGCVSFRYDTRIDLKGDKRLSKIHVRNNASPSFNTSFELINNAYFTANATGGGFTKPNTTTDEDLFYKRLKLNEVRQQDAFGNHGKVYKFVYDENLLPAKNSFARDHWGFYNGASGNSTFLPAMNYINPANNASTKVVKYTGADREPNSSFSQAFLLKKIHYPTGGVSTLTYEQNDFDIGKSINALGHVPYPEIEEISESYYTRRLSNTDNNESFSLNIPEIMSGTEIELVINSREGQDQGGTPTYPESAYLEIYAEGATTPIKYIALGTPSEWESMGDNRFRRVDQPNLAPGNYTVVSHIGDNVLFLNYIDFTFTFTSQINSTNNHEVRAGGGVRIARIENFDPIANKKIIQKYEYSYKKDRDGDGVLEEYSYGRRLSSLRYISEELIPACKGGALACNPFSISSSSTVQSLSPVVGYDTVIVLYGEGGEKGKSEYYYENVSDLEIRYQGTKYDLALERPVGVQNFINPKNGLLKQSVDFRFNNMINTFEKQKEVIYNYVSSPVLTQVGIRKLTTVYSKAFTGSEDYLCFTDYCDWRLAQYPAFQSSWIYLASEIIRRYDNNSNQFVETTTEYFYESDDPKHYQPVSINKYNSKGGKLITILKYPHDFATVAPYTSMVNRNIIAPVIEKLMYKDGVFLTSTRTNYRDWGSDIITPDTVETREGQSEYETRLRYHNYDEKGNILTLSKEKGVLTSYLWAYGKSLPVIKAENIAISDLETKVGQVLTEMGYSNGISDLEKFYSSLGDLITPNEKSNWRSFNEKLRAQFVSLNISVAVYAYNPILGMTSSSSPSGDINYYEYDGFGRLIRVRDDEMNVLKQYEYRYAQEQ